MNEQIAAAIKSVWGYDTLRPLQAEAIRAGIDQRDSLVVMPTGGGKSLCYQVPPLLTEGATGIVVSPLISLMKDQVDGLQLNGYSAGALHSGLSPDEARAIEQRALAGELRLLFVSPERVLTPRFMNLMKRIGVASLAIDEAHCISQWGHDFRPEYRRIAELRTRFPELPIHAFTATATEQVRDDIVAQLGLRDPLVLVGIFDRPNLTYRVQPRTSLADQCHSTLARHGNEAAIIYCLSRRDTEGLAAQLTSKGIPAEAYHAGMSSDARRNVQDAFSTESLNVVCATVAFGMGIDRSNVRCVIHASMPKSVEAYQQETGRAGRDGLEAECVLLYSGEDLFRWQGLIERSASEGDADPSFLQAQIELLMRMRRYATASTCRHKLLSEYFGQEYAGTQTEGKNGCSGCDICLGEIKMLDDSQVVAQKIISCIARTEQRFGAGHVADVLRGSGSKRIRDKNHHTLSTYGLLPNLARSAIVSFIDQIVDQGAAQRTLVTSHTGQFPIITLTAESREVLRGDREIKLLVPPSEAAVRTGAGEWEGVDRDLFETLRILRKQLADERNVPPYVIFADDALRDMARRQPTSPAAMLRIRGVGTTKLSAFGAQFIGAICKHKGIDPDSVEEVPDLSAPVSRRPNPEKIKAFELFSEQATVEQVVAKTGRAASTVFGYLEEFIITNRPESIDCWVKPIVQEQVDACLSENEKQMLRPLYERLDGAVPYELLRLIRAFRSTGAQRESDTAAESAASTS